jgi:hypothetical protein
MKVLGIDPAPAKNSIVFDGKEFLRLTPKELKVYIDSIKEDTFIAWDSPLSGAIEEGEFSLTIRKIESFFYRQSKTARELNIPKGISTLGFSSCPHWTISQYIFGYPIMNYDLVHNLKWDLVMNNEQISKQPLQITETHPALSIWIILKDILKEHPLFKNSWQYKGYSNSDKNIKKRLEVIINELFKTNFVTDIFKDRVVINSDDELDAFVCYILGMQLFNNEAKAHILGNNILGSFLLPNINNNQILTKFDNFCISFL